MINEKEIIETLANFATNFWQAYNTIGFVQAQLTGNVNLIAQAMKIIQFEDLTDLILNLPTSLDHPLVLPEIWFRVYDMGEHGFVGTCALYDQKLENIAELISYLESLQMLEFICEHNELYHSSSDTRYDEMLWVLYRGKYTVTINENFMQELSRINVGMALDEIEVPKYLEWTMGCSVYWYNDQKPCEIQLKYGVKLAVTGAELLKIYELLKDARSAQPAL